MKRLTLLSVVFLSYASVLFGQSSANYSFTTNTSGSLVADKNSNTIDMTSGATSLVAAGNDDVASSATSISFDFWFMGSRYTQFSASSNGIIRLGSIAISSTSYSIAAAAEAVISPFALDMATAASTGYVKSKVVGSAPNRCLVVEWKDMEVSYSSTSANGTFQARLYESTSEIEFVYGTLSYNTLPASGSRLVYVGFSSNTTNNTYATVNTSAGTVTTSGGATSNDYGASGYPKTPTNLTSGRLYRFTPSGVNAPSGLGVTCASGSSATLSWTDNASNESGYAIYYSTSNPVALQSSTYYGTVAANSVSTTVTGLTVGTTYYYVLVAYREGITSSITGTSTCTNPPTSPSLYNTSAAGSTTHTSFNNCRNNDLTPLFTFAATHTSTYNRIQIELNTKSDFSGTSYKQTFSGTYSSATKYDVTCTALDNGGLPNSECLYFVRARASADGGTQWSSYTTGNWIYTYATTELGYHFTTKEQFDLGSLVSTSYGNFIVTNNNGTTAVLTDDYVELNQASTTTYLSSASNQYLTELTTNYSGSGYSYLTLGSYYFGGTAEPDYHGFRFPSAKVPQGATISSATMTVYTSHTGGEPDPDNANPLYLKVRGVSQDNCNTWSNSTNTSTGDPKNRVRTTAAVDWDIASSWSDGSAQTSPSITTVIQEITDRASYAAGNAIGLILDYDAALPTSANRHRYLSTMARSASYEAQLDLSFTNYTNDIQFPNIALSNFAGNGGTVSWNKLYFDVDKASCGSCDVTFYVYNASGPTLITSGNTSPLTISGAGTAANIYVVARIRRNSSPKLNSFTVTVTNGLLPVKLNTFDIGCQGNTSTFNWVTESEVNNKGFYVEGSEDGKSFYRVSDFIKGNGNSITEKKYSYQLNKQEVARYNYFRLYQEDYDGKTDYSSTIYNTCYNAPSKPAEISIYPNPASTKITILLDEYLRTKDELFVRIYDSIGKEIKSTQINKGSEELLELPLDDLPSGMYMVQITGGIYHSSKAFLKKN